MLIPISRPSDVTTGPPEEPGSSGAVCSTLPVMRRPRGPRKERSTPETNPNVTRSPRPPGLASANTGVPMLAAAPSGFFGILFAESYRVRSPEVGSMVIASTVFSIATLAVTIGILYPQ